MATNDDLGSRDVTMRKVVRASPDAVFRLWTEAELLKKWWGPPGVTCPEADIDLRVGGRYRIANLMPSGTIVWIQGEYEVIDSPHQLRYTWGIGLDAPAEERVTVTFSPHPDGTEVVVYHENAADVPTRDGHEQGWKGCLDGLAELALRPHPPL